MFRGDAACSGVAADPLPGRLTLRWKFEAGEPFMSSAAIVDGSVYVGCDDEHLYAIELSDGKVKWKYRTQSFVQSSPTVAGDLVVIGDDDGMLHAVDRRTGLRKWTYASGAQIISSPNVHGGRVIFGSYDLSPAGSSKPASRSCLPRRSWMVQSTSGVTTSISTPSN